MDGPCPAGEAAERLEDGCRRRYAFCKFSHDGFVPEKFRTNTSVKCLFGFLDYIGEILEELLVDVFRKCLFKVLQL